MAGNAVNPRAQVITAAGEGIALGMLTYRSGMFPRILGILLMLGTVSYVIHALAQFFAFGFAQGLSSVLMIPETLNEVALLLYLLIKGVRTLPT